VLRIVLQRQGVVDAMLTDDVLVMAQGQVAPTTFESYWTSHASGLLKSSQVSAYYEGLCLSLLLDHSGDPAVWMQLAARRWVSLNLVADGCTWDTARGLLPMTGLGNLPASLMTELYKAAKSRSDFMPKKQSNQSSFRGGLQDYNRVNANSKSGNGGTGAAAKPKKEAAAGSDKKNKGKRPQRGSAGGPGASASANAAGASGE
jgi:hypothetical protein